jgi:hypothetical protein
MLSAVASCNANSFTQTLLVALSLSTTGSCLQEESANLKLFIIFKLLYCDLSTYFYAATKLYLHLQFFTLINSKNIYI